MSPSDDVGRSRAGGGAGGGWRQAPTEKVYSCDRADRDRGIEAWAGSVLGALDVLFTLNAVFRSVRPYTVILLFCGCALILYGAGRFVLRSQVCGSAGRWRPGAGSVEFGPCWGFLLWEQMPPVMAVVGAVVVLRMPVPSGVTHSGTARVLPLVLAVLGGAAVTWASMPVNPPRNSEIILDPLGMWLWPGGRHRAFIPWALEPVVAGRARHGTQVCAAITLSTGPPVYFPMFPIPLGYVQLQRVVEFYSTHPELRDELAAEAGLERVRTLMSIPVWQIEEEESLSLPTAYAHTPAASNKACAPGGGTAAVSPAVASDASEPPIPPGVLDCARADRRRMAAPRRALVGALGILAALIAVLAAELRTTMIFLLVATFILMLLRAAALYVFRSPLEHADEQWVLSDSGVALPSLWASPLATRMGAAALLLTGLFSFSAAAAAIPHKEQLRVPSMAAAVVCVVVALMVWSGTRRPHGGPEILLDPRGARFAPGTGREVVLPWDGHPRVVGASRGQMLVGLLNDPGAGLVRLPMDALTAGCTQLRQVMELYSTRPELRRELAAEAGLERVRTLMRGPV